MQWGLTLILFQLSSQARGGSERQKEAEKTYDWKIRERVRQKDR